MRVLQVVVGYHPARGEFGGIVESVENISRTLTARGHEVEVWTTALVGRGRPLALRDVTALCQGIPVRYFNTFHPRQLGYGFAISPSFARAALREVGSFDVVHINRYRNHLALSAVIACRRAGVPFVVQPRGTIVAVVQRVRAKQWFDRIVGHAQLADAAALLAISRSEARFFADHGVPAAKTHVVYNGVDEGMRTLDLGDGDWFRTELGIRAPHVILYVGRIHVRKGIQHLVTAVVRLAAQRDDLHLVVLGADDGYAPELERQIAASGAGDHVTLPGPRYGLAKYRAYRSAALVAYPATHEYFGHVPFEGLLCGTPAVVCDDGGCAEVLSDIDGGWTVPWADPAALEKVIAEALREREEQPRAWARRVRRAQEGILARYTWDAGVDRIESIYRAALRQGF